MLTSVAFSIHDTIVVFDRVRENLRVGPRLTFDQVINLSTVQTMTRSLNTSLTVVFVLLSLVIFGGDSIRGFVLALLIGIVTGTYSSIFNASTLLVAWEKARGSRAVAPPAGRRRVTPRTVVGPDPRSAHTTYEQRRRLRYRVAAAPLVRPSRHRARRRAVVGTGRGAVLRLVIDRDDGGVTLDDCERASNTASAVLDVNDPIDHPYRLEVSSPGAERPIRRPEEWIAAVGRRINVRLRDGDAELVLEGKLIAVTGSDAEIEVRERRTSTRAVDFSLDSVLAARIVVDI